MFRRSVLVAFVLFVLVACGGLQAGQVSPTTTVPTTVATAISVSPPTAAPTDTPRPAPTEAPTQTSAPTGTARPTSTPLPPPTPTATITPTAETTVDDEFSANFVSTKESAGVRLEVARIDIARKDVLPEIGFDKVEKFKEYDVVAEIIFRVTNTTDKTIVIYPDQAKVVVNNEQINLQDWAYTGAAFGTVSGEILPGVTTSGGLWFGVKRAKVPEINKMVIAIDGPRNKDTYTALGDDYYFELDLSKHERQPIPEELK